MNFDNEPEHPQHTNRGRAHDRRDSDDLFEDHAYDDVGNDGDTGDTPGRNSDSQGGYTGFAGYGSYEEHPHRDKGAPASAVASQPVESSETATFDDEPEDAPKSKVPLRAIGIILLIVAALLIAFGIFHMVSDDKDDGQSSDHSAIPSASVHSDHPGSETGSGAHQPSTNPHHPHGADGAQPSTATGPAESGGAGHHGAPAAPGAPGSSGSHGNGAEGSVDKSKIQVTVLNNSRIQGLAEKVTKHLSADHWSNTSFGNLPGDGGAAFPDSVVLYDDNVESKAAATEVATTLGLKAQPKTDQTNQQLTNAKMLSGQHPGSVIVVTTADMNP